MAKDLDYYLAQARRIAEHREAGAEKKIRKLYKAMLKDLQQFMSETYIQYAEDDRLTYAMLQKAGYDARFLDEIEQRLNIATPAAAKQLWELVEETYTAAYDGMIRGVQKVAQGEPLEEVFAEFVAITPEQIKAAVENPISGLTLSDTLEKNRRDIIYSIKREIGVGLMNGDRYTTMARRISERLDGDYKKAVRIARTEARRAQEAGNNDAATSVDEALKRGTTGLRFVKVWKTLQDERVRPQRTRKGKKGWKTTMGRGANHMRLNGQTVLQDEPFDLGDGVTAVAPLQSGVAAHDIECRCYVSRIMMTDAEFFEATGRHFPENGTRGAAASDLNIQRPNNEITSYNKAADYTIDIPGLPDEVNKGLSKACENVAKLGTERNREVLNLVDLSNGKAIFVEIGEEGEVGGFDFWQFIEKHPDGKFAFVHNHPTDGFLSSTDMQTFMSTPEIACMIAVSNDGLKRIAYGNVKTNEMLQLLYDEEVTVLRQKLRNGIIQDTDYTFELEKLLVENAIKDFANLGFWEVDGRV
ncbi:MAG: phage minor head protein [Oscillospiraceae bacterium]|jgi:uncharacterized protein with gpF-like domain